MKVPVWEKLQKEMTWHQIGELSGKRILDFGSGNGMTADHYAKNNEVIAIEPDEEAIKTVLTKIYTFNYAEVLTNYMNLKIIILM